MTLCDVCGRREEESTVVIGGEVMLVCGTCLERANDEMEEPE